MTERWRPTTPTEKLSWLMRFRFVAVEHGLAKGCRCGSCETFRMSWEDEHDQLRDLENENLERLIDHAWRELEEA